MVRAGNNRFICRFSNVNDQERIEEQQPWMVMGCLILMETFSTGMVAANITFERLPLWMSFRGLELEHLKLRYCEIDWRNCRDCYICLTYGCDTPYNNLPNLYCSLCHRLGHNHSGCSFPEAPQIAQDRNPNIHVMPSHEGSLDRQLVLWPHQQQNIIPPATENMETGQNSNCLQGSRPGLQCINSAGLEQVNFSGTQHVQFHRCKAYELTIIQLQTHSETFQNNDLSVLGLDSVQSPIIYPNNTNTDLLNSLLPRSQINQQQNLSQFNLPLTIQEPSLENQPPRRRRGRSIGSVNKTKLPIDRKVKGKLHSNDKE
ncbi:hypothetical protein FRX31_030467 [Thalictrum thalictroides]|uniref:Uncharacterized protein n=1 Tax=Thalictrum thalictroides TaxID=46969 RepID=A0A7J6V4P6_THATH|nr:hypothetical protein FRX31_030467 [Thalictrum thalictroides]